MILKVKSEIEVNTSNAYNKNVYAIKNNIIIPYVNIEIFNINFSSQGLKQQDRINFSYLIFKNVSELIWHFSINNESKIGKITFNKYTNDNLDYISVFNVNKNIDGAELKIRYEKQYLYLANDFKKDIKHWAPFDTPNFKKNIEAEDFFNSYQIPQEILDRFNLTNNFELKEINFLDFINDLTLVEEEISKWVET